VPEEQQPFVKQKLIAAWNMAGYAEAAASENELE
jgi:hypothetical protein